MLCFSRFLRSFWTVCFSAFIGMFAVNSCLAAYTVTYSNLLDATWDENQLHPDSYTTGEEITIGIPTREGYAFDGWCDDVELQENCSSTKTILSTDTGDKTFYAKWIAAPCGPGYESQTNPFNDTDYKAAAMAYAYFDNVNGTTTLVANRGRDNAVNVDLDESLETLPVGRFELFFNENAEDVRFYGMLYGRAQCSTTPGYQGNWRFAGHGQSVPDTISETPGDYCWCQLDGFTPYTLSGSKWVPSGERSNFLTKWLSPGGGTGCATYPCVKYCVEKLRTWLPDRQALYGPGAFPPCKIKTYTISYELDGGEWPIALVSKPETYNITSATINLPTPAEREGYTFGGWYDNNSFTGNLITQIPSGSYGNKTFYAKWARDSYTITFDLGDGNTNTETYTLGETVNLPQQAKDGYAFVGYCVNSSNCSLQERVMQLNYDVIPENPITLYPQFLKEVVVQEPGICEGNDCRVAIDLGDNDIIEQVYDNGDSLVLPEQNSESHAVFNGYCEGAPTCVDPVMNLTYEQVTSGSVFYPQMIETSAEEIPSNADRTCESDTCSIIVNIPTQAPVQTRVLRMLRNTRSASTSTYNETTVKTFNEGDLMILPVPTKQNYKLDGYCVGEEASCEEPVMAVTNDDLQDDSVTITPQWSAECPEEYPEMDESTRQCYRSWSCEEEPVCPENSKNCAYAGATSGRVYVDQPANTICAVSFECEDGYEKNSDTDTCEPITYTITYTITYNSNGGTEIQSDTYVMNINNPKVLPSPTKLGYTFDGWYTNSDFNGSAVTAINPGDFGDKTFYAKWAFNSCPDGYRQSCSFGIRKGTVLTAFASKSLDGTTDDSNNAAPETYGLTQPGQWGSTFDHGDIIGISKCSASNGGGIISGQAGNPTNTDGSFCWCQATRFIPADGNGTVCDSTSGQWIILGSKNTTANCNLRCAQDCALWQKGDDVYRSNVYTGGLTGINSAFWESLVGYNNDICVLSTYTISYIMNSGQFPVGANQKTTYRYEDDTITIPAPIRSGHDFLGWCDNAELTENCLMTKTISYHSYGDKIFYAKWKFTGCDEGYTFYPTSVSDLDTSANGTSYGQISINGVNTSYASNNGLGYAYGYGSGSWATNFDYGRIYGVAKCSSRSGNNHGNKWNGLVSDWSVSDEILDAATDGYHCWCSLADFLPLNGTKQSVSPKSWIYGYTPSTSSSNMYTECENSCATYCATTLRDNFYFRSALYGGQCRAVSYTIKYMDGEIERTDLSPQKYTIENTITLPTPIKFGYTFDGWYRQSDFSGTRAINIPVGSMGDEIFYAKWMDTQCPNGYNFKAYEPALVGANFSLNSPSSYQAFNGGVDRIGGLSLERGEWAKQLPFSGIVFGNSVCSAKTGVNYDKTTTDELANFESGENCWCQLTEFVPTDGTSQELSKTSWVYTRYNYSDRPCQNECSPECAAAFSNQSEFRNKMIATCEPNTYTITYNSLGGTEIAPLDYKVTDTITLPEPEKSGYVFNGWCVNSSNCDTPVNGVQTGWFEDKTLYAQWGCEPGYHLNENDICEITTYVVKFQDGSRVLDQLTQTYTIESENPVVSVATEKTGYVFAGWCNSAEDTIDSSAMCQMTVTVAPDEISDKTFYAKWFANSCPTGNTTPTQNFLETTNVSANGTNYFSVSVNSDYCTYDGFGGNGGNVCSVPISHGITPGNWMVLFDYGELRGTSFCGQMNRPAGTLANIDTSETGSYCWCKPTSFSPINETNYTTISPWISIGTVYVGTCEKFCSAFCGMYISTNRDSLRSKLYSMSNVCLTSDVPEIYGITYDLGDGTWGEDPVNPETYTITTLKFTISHPERTGYTFLGWCEGENNTQCDNPVKDLEIDPEQHTLEPIYLYAQWTENTPSVSDCGEGYDVYYNPLSSMDTSKAGTQYGYLSQDGALTSNADVYGLSDNGTWGVTFDYGKVIGNSTCDDYHCICSLTGFIPDNNGAYGELQPVSTNRTITPVAYGYSSSITNANDGCRNGCAAGCAFWVSSSSGQQRRQTLYANICLPITYTIHLASNDGTEYSDETYTVESETITLPTDVTREGYTFGGWYETNEFTGDPKTEVPQGSTGDKTFYAKWDSTEPLSCPPDYELITNLSELDKRINSGNGRWPYGQILTEAVCSASASGEPDTTTQGGYCWCRATGLKTKDNIFHAAPDAPWTFGVALSNYDNCTAQCSGEVCRRFEANESIREAMYKGDLDTPACVEKTYMVQYIPNGGTIAPTDPRFFYTATSSSVSKPTSISRSGYTFAGWCESEEDANDANIVACQMETNVQPSDKQDKTFYAKWTEIPIEPEFECTSHAWLHIGDAKACLSKTKVGSPAFALKTAKSTYYLQTSLDPDLQLNKDTSKKWRMDFNGTTYNIHDETVSGNGE